VSLDTDLLASPVSGACRRVRFAHVGRCPSVDTTASESRRRFLVGNRHEKPLTQCAMGKRSKSRSYHVGVKRINVIEIINQLTVGKQTNISFLNVFLLVLLRLSITVETEGYVGLRPVAGSFQSFEWFSAAVLHLITHVSSSVFAY
jgi:hypothetical protein